MPDRHLTRNAAKCLSCGDIIESRHVHDFVWCGCGKIAVDGGQPAFDLIADDPDHEYEYPKGSFNRSGGLHERLYRVAEEMGSPDQ